MDSRSPGSGVAREEAVAENRYGVDTIDRSAEIVAVVIIENAINNKRRAQKAENSPTAGIKTTILAVGVFYKSAVFNSRGSFAIDTPAGKFQAVGAGAAIPDGEAFQDRRSPFGDK